LSDKRKLIVILLVVIGSAGIFSLYFFIFEGKGLGPREDYRATVGASAPEFSLPTLRGDFVKLSDYRGKVVFLNIWATWCGPCREEMPFMEALYQRLKGRQFEMLAISIDRGGKETVGSFVSKYGLRFPVLLDPESKTYKLYGLTGVPETFIIDRKGIILYKAIGPQEWMKKDWLDYFDRILG
jgi:peroxiredoxin